VNLLILEYFVYSYSVSNFFDLCVFFLLFFLINIIFFVQLLKIAWQFEDTPILRFVHLKKNVQDQREKLEGGKNAVCLRTVFEF